MRISFHGFANLLGHVFDKAQVEGASTILVSLKLGDGCLGSFGGVELDHATATRAAAWLILDFGLFDLAYSSEQLDEIVVAS